MSYSDRVLALHSDHLLAYWPGDESSGLVATDASGHARHGSYLGGISLGARGIGDGTTAPLYDGTTGATDIYSADLAADWHGDEVSVLLWFKVRDLLVWTNAITGRLLTIQVDAGNRILIQKNSAVNSFSVFYNAGGVVRLRTKTAFNPIGWTCVLLTASKSANQAKVSINGSQQGATLTGMGLWAGALSPLATVIGAQQPVSPVSLFPGSIGHVALWNTILTADEVTDLAIADTTEPGAFFTARARPLEFTAQARPLEFTGRSR